MSYRMTSYVPWRYSSAYCRTVRFLAVVVVHMAFVLLIQGAVEQTEQFWRDNPRAVEEVVLLWLVAIPSLVDFIIRVQNTRIFWVVVFQKQQIFDRDTKSFSM